MKKKRITLTIFAATVLLTFILVTVIFVINNPKSNQYTYLEGVVTAYDPTPSFSDGLIIFSIDNIDVDIGGGLRGYDTWGDVEYPIAVGEKVKAKLIKSDHGSLLTIYNCAECYVKKIN